MSTSTPTGPDLPVTIRPLDLGSDAEIEQYIALDRALDEHAFGGSEATTVERKRAELADSPYWTSRRWVAVAETMEGAQSIVGRAGVQLATRENTDTAYVGAAVHPAFRGHGIGTALVEQAIVPAVRECGRSLVSAWVEIPAEGEIEDPSTPAVRLSRRFGLERRSVGVCRVLPLPLDAALLERLGAEAEERIGDYRIEVWDDVVPEEHLAAYGALLHQLDLDDPDEDVEDEPAEYTPERIRTSEERRRASGTRAIIAVAIAPDGTFAGNSEIHIGTGEGTTLGWQENTLVMPEHRGHRLGLALKVATHRLLAERAPGLRVLVTYNSHVNPWMIAINEKLGYRVRSREIAYQGRPDLG
ncbi:GNAT family N-acetyltransferase [Brachybacterium huguangmaarense]